MSAVLKWECDSALYDAVRGWRPLLAGFGVRLLMAGEVVCPGDFHLSESGAGGALYVGSYGFGKRVCHAGSSDVEAVNAVAWVYRYTDRNGDAPALMISVCVRSQIEAAQESAWADLCEAVDLFRAALTTGKPDLIRMRDMRALEIMDKNDFGCRVIFDSLSGHVWREYGERNEIDDYLD